MITDDKVPSKLRELIMSNEIVEKKAGRPLRKNSSNQKNRITPEQMISSLNKMSHKLKKKIIGRGREIDFLLACVAVEVPILLLGDPGTGKSYLVKEFTNMVSATDNDYFHYLLTQFTEPSEIFGPLDVNKLLGKDGKTPKFSNITAGKMPEATVVFLDEVFKANSAILNTLLTITNEKKFYNNGKWDDVPLRVLITASNEMPEDEALKAFVDRIPIRVHSSYLDFTTDNNYLEKLIEVQLDNENSSKNYTNSADREEAVMTIAQLSNGIDALFNSVHSRIASIMNDGTIAPALKNKISKIRARDKTGMFNCNLSDRKIIAILKVTVAKKMIKTNNVNCEITFQDIKDTLKQTWDDLKSENALITEINNES